MKSLFPCVALTSLALGVCATGYAQDPVPIEFYRPLKNSVSVGARMFGGNAKVGFSNLGAIPSGFASGNTDALGNRYYHNGTVSADSARPDDTGGTDKDGNPIQYGIASATTSTDGTTKTWFERSPVAGATDRYTLRKYIEYTDPTDSTKNYQSNAIIGEYVDYRSDYTRSWSYSSASQVRSSGGAGVVDMSIYNVNSLGGVGAQAESDDGPGVELQFGHVIKRYKRFEWGLNFSAGAATINAKTRSVVRANLHTSTDTYALAATNSFGQPVGAGSFPFDWYQSGQENETITDTANVTPAPTDPVANSYIKEGYHYLGAQPIGHGETDTPVDVFGYWQIKGAYYLLRAGPIVRFPFAKKWTVTAGAGLAGAFVGTDFIVDEYIVRSDLSAPLRSPSQLKSSEKRFIPGFYADVNIERWITVRTGFFVGYGYESLGKYDQYVDGRKAEIDLGSSKGFRFGVITRF